MQVAILGKTGMNGHERREPRCRGCGPWNLPGEWAHLGKGYGLVTKRPHIGALRKTDTYFPLINSPHTARPALRNRLELWLFWARTQMPVSWPCHLLGCCPWLQDCSQIMRCHWTGKRVQGSKFLLEQVRQEWRIPLLFAFHGWQLAMWPHPATRKAGVCIHGFSFGVMYPERKGEQIMVGEQWPVFTKWGIPVQILKWWIST